MKFKAIVLGMVVSLILPLAGVSARAISNASASDTGTVFVLDTGVADSKFTVAHRSKKHKRFSGKKGHKKSRGKGSRHSKKKDYSKSR